MAKQRKYLNPALRGCEELLKQDIYLGKKANAECVKIKKARNRAESFESQRKELHYKICSEIAKQILASDLNLDEKEYTFLTILIPQKFSTKKRIMLLEDLIRRNRHNFYPPIGERTIIKKVQIYKIIGTDTRIVDFFKRLNRKLEGFVILKVYTAFNSKKLELKEESVSIELSFC